MNIYDMFMAAIDNQNKYVREVREHLGELMEAFQISADLPENFVSLKTSISDEEILEYGFSGEFYCFTMSVSDKEKYDPETGKSYPSLDVSIDIGWTNIGRLIVKIGEKKYFLADAPQMTGACEAIQTLFMDNMPRSPYATTK